MSYRRTVIELVARSITEFSLPVGHNTTPQLLLPDIWVDRNKLYQYQTTLNDGERRRYKLTFGELLNFGELLGLYEYDPYIRYIEQST